MAPEAAGSPANGAGTTPEGLAAVMAAAEATVLHGRRGDLAGPHRVGVDLGTAVVVVVVTDEAGMPVAGAHREAEVVRDGVVVDFVGACRVLGELVAEVTERLGHPLEAAAACYPPGVGRGEVEAVRHVVESAGLECVALVDEPTAANAVLAVRDGAVVDVGGGTTGIALIRDGEVQRTVDEPTGGHHLDLVLAGGLGVSLEEARRRKTDPSWQPRLAPMVRPVLEKIGALVARGVAGEPIAAVHLVGGTAALPGADAAIGGWAGLPIVVPPSPLLVTPVGTARHGAPVARSIPEPVRVR